MASKFIRALFVLGITCGALGIFFLLQRAFHFQFALVNPTWTVAIIIIFLLLVCAVMLLALHRRAPVRPPRRVPVGPPRPSTQKTENISLISVLNAKKIIDEINDAVPFQRDEIARKYHGFKVNWKGKLGNVTKAFAEITGESVGVQLHPEPENLRYSVFFSVPIAKYPQFKVAREGDFISVVGRIITCSGVGMSVELDVDEITFLKDS